MFEFQDCQGFPRTGKDLSSSEPVLTSATFSLTSPGPVLTSAGESWRYAGKDWNTEKIQNRFRAYKGRIGSLYSWNNCNWAQEDDFFSMLTYENREK